MSRRVVVIGGGTNVEHEVSLASARSVADALESRGWRVERLTIDRDGRWRHGGDPLADCVPASFAAAVALIGRCDVAFPLVHGPGGEDGTLAAVCTLAGTRYVGSGLRAGASAMDKWTAKQVARAANVATAPGRITSLETERDGNAHEAAVAQPLVVKPVSSGSSFGVSLVTESYQLLPALRRAASVDPRILVEPFVHGREIDVAVLRAADGTRWAAPPLEIHHDGIFTAEAKYDGTAQFSVPADLTPTEHQAVTAAALRAFDAFGCRGVARVDFFLTEDAVIMNEINTVPGMTPDSQVPKMFQAAGMAYPDLVDQLALTAALSDDVGTRG